MLFWPFTKNINENTAASRLFRAHWADLTWSLPSGTKSADVPNQPRIDVYRERSKRRALGLIEKCR